MIILTLRYTAVKNSEELSKPECFSILKDNDSILLCGETQEEADEWVCLLKTGIGQPCKEEKTPGVSVTVEERIVKPIIIMPMSSPDCEKDWDY